MSINLVEAWREKQRVKLIVKFLLRRVAQPCVLVVLAYVFPKMAIFYALCGLYDVSRNRVNVTTLRMRATVYVTRLLTESFKFVYYQNWKVIQS